ncbi:MAG: SBBP repeat-containing protein [Bacteroidetes bacterium]|nr:SBBP repeat-containing protein [Bacteroidota bacterium]
MFTKNKTTGLQRALSVFYILACIYGRAQIITKPQAHGSASTPEARNLLNGNGMCFTPNKGQIADTEGKLCPDILYKGEGGGADIYLRKTGISYVYSNMGEVMHMVGEQVEELITAGTITETDEQQKRDELLRDRKVKVHRVDMDFEGANTNSRLINESELEGYNNYYYAHCPQGIANVHQYNKVTYKNIYNNIDITYYGDKENGIKYDLIVKPHADPNQIKLHWKGAESIRINREGNLVVKTSVNEFTESIPKVYQNINGGIVDVKAGYKLAFLSASNGERGEGIVTFILSNYQTDYPLIIDPWATYYGGTDYDHGIGIATDPLGNAYMTGETWNFVGIASLGFQTVFGGAIDAFLVKFNGMTGVRLWATYYGGAGGDSGKSIATDILGNVYMAGETQSNVGISWLGHQNIYSGGIDAFLVKFNGINGVRIWATYYGGTAWDDSRSIACDNTGNVYLAGTSSSLASIAFAPGFQIVNGGGFCDAFLVKFNCITGTCIWATYYGGTDFDYGYGVACDNIGNVYMVGVTRSLTGISSPPCIQIIKGGGDDAFLVKFNENTGVRIWATYYGGTARDFGFSVTCDNIGNVYLAGSTRSPVGIASVTGFQAVLGGMVDAFIVKIQGFTGALLWSTYYGDVFSEIVMPGCIVTDLNNNVYLYFEVEDENSLSLVDGCSYNPVFNEGLKTNPNGSNWVEDQIIVKFNSVGKKLCATYVGGAGEDDIDYGGGIAIYDNSLFITGSTDGGYPATTGAFQTGYSGPLISNLVGNSGGGDAFVVSLCTNICEGKVLDINYTASSTSVCANAPITFTPSIAHSCDTTGYKFHWTFTGGSPASSDSVKPTVTFSGAGTHDVKLVVTTICKKDSITINNYITTTQCTACNLTGQFTKGTASCTGCGCKEWILVNATSGTSPYTYLWPDGYTNRYKNQLCPGTYIINIKDKNGCSINVNISAP